MHTPNHLWLEGNGQQNTQVGTSAMGKNGSVVVPLHHGMSTMQGSCQRQGMHHSLPRQLGSGDLDTVFSQSPKMDTRATDRSHNY